MHLEASACGVTGRADLALVEHEMQKRTELVSLMNRNGMRSEQYLISVHINTLLNVSRSAVIQWNL